MVEYMEFLREDLTLTDNTYAETEIQCPVGRSENIVMAIHAVEFSWNSVDIKTDADQINLHLSKKSKTNIGDDDWTQANIADPDTIAVMHLFGMLTTSGAAVFDRVKRVDFKIPVLIANNKLYFGGRGDGLTKGLIRIHYTLRRVSRAELYDALVD